MLLQHKTLQLQNLFCRPNINEPVWSKKGPEVYRRSIITLLIVAVASILAIAIQQPAASPSLAQGLATTQPSPGAVDEADPPFKLPFAEPPGPFTWLMAQPYGSTVGAYYQRRTIYGASGGIHFGLDLAAPCGTDIVAIADGIVFAVDGPFGSPPHNLMIDHSELGYASMYGHLLEAPRLSPGQIVKQGDVVAKVGDSGNDCNGSPHLHLEIRDLKHFRKFNPINLIEANWDQLVLYGGWSRGFMRDLDEPRQWQTLYEQPEVQTGGPIVNDFERTWPFDWRKAASQVTSEQPGPTATPVEPDGSAASAEPARPAGDPALALPANVRQIKRGNCCTNIYWSQDSTEVRFIDQPTAVEPTGIWGVDVRQPEAEPRFVGDRLGIYNAEKTLVAYPDTSEGIVVVESLADGQRWKIDTDGNGLSFTPGGQVLWTAYDAEVSWRARAADIWLADVDGRNADILASIRRGGPAAWLSDRELLVASRIPPQQDILLSTLSLEDGTLSKLVQLPRTRGAMFSPDKRYMAYLVRFHADSDKNGLWLLDLQDPTLKSRPLPFFGAYRWRDDRRLIYVPFEPAATGLTFYEYDAKTGRTRQLFPQEGTPLELTIANNDWQVSPDGSRIALVAADGKALDGIWVIDIGQD